MKKIILVVSIVAVILIAYQVLKNNFVDDEIKNDTTITQQDEKQKVIPINKEVEGIEIKNIKIMKEEKNKYTVVGEVENKSHETKKSRVATLKCKNQKDEDVIFAVILPELVKGETSNFSTILFQDISEVESIEIEVEKEEESK